ncbi:hypothetical protein Ahy_B02g057253 [Arachis hypogaea]|uniref:Uncharacterized protein n=1 Tax=Arachis hypogaea TaxID=3818 RepID=A0A445ABC4_ARAHY|nr:hypothetical protein Ahy_B02g057253 [Arachis hypogaea]
MVLYRVPEMLSAEILQQTRVSSKDDGIPVVTAEDLAVADVVLFGFLMRYRSMVEAIKRSAVDVVQLKELENDMGRIYTLKENFGILR